VVAGEDNQVSSDSHEWRLGTGVRTSNRRPATPVIDVNFPEGLSIPERMQFIRKQVIAQLR
jgi:hypothetical protein